MKTKLTLFLILMLVTACAPAATQAPATEVPATELPATEPPSTAGACPTATSGTTLLTNAEGGYCLLYPAEYSATEPQAVEIDPAVAQGGTMWQQFIIINPISAPGDVPGDAWLYIQVQDAAGKTAAQIVDEQVTALGEGFNISTSEVSVGGEPAVMVDGLPGQDSNRQVFVVHNGRLYDLVFMPWFPNPAEPTPLENLYTTVLNSFQFLPQ